MNKSLSIFLPIVFVAFASSHFGCKNGGINPPELPQGVDTTSHDFTWRIDTIGAQGVLYDVAIVDENQIWAVGEIYLRDSTGIVDPTAYSVAVWNGSRWQLKRLYYSTTNIIAPIRGVLNLAANDIWLAAGSIFHWDGSSAEAQLSFSRLNLPDPNATVEKLWGASGSFIYAVGNAGTMVYFSGSSWQKIETGTNIALTDAWGIPAVGSQNELVIAVGSDLINGTNHHVFAVTPTGVKDTLAWTMDKTPFGIWFANGSTVYISGNGLWKYKNSSWSEISSFNFVNHVRGTGDNNVFAAGSFAFITHYNGSTWKEYPQLQMSNVVLRGLAVHSKVVVAVGDAADIPIVIRGYPL